MVIMTTKDYKDYVIDKLNIEKITTRPMMGEYLLYYKNILFGGIYDNRLLVKKTSNNQKYSLESAIPYKGAKEMYLVDLNDNRDTIVKIIIDTYNDLVKK